MRLFNGDPISPSSRGLANLRPNPMFDLEREKESYPAYDSTDCPDGLIDISSAKNALMADDLRDWCEKHRDAIFHDVMETLEYGATAGSNDLRTAIAAYTAQYFNPTQPVSPDSIIVGNGVSSLLGTLAYNICESGEAIMLEVPNYGMFGSDLTYQTGTQLVHVHTDSIKDRFSSHCASQLINAYEQSFQTAEKGGVRIKAILICNPCNPLGRCYSRTSLQMIAEFCFRHSLHLISDEIYALSSGQSSGMMDGFTSALSLSDDSGISSKNIHVLSGASKDFGLGGIRLGWIITRNELLWQTVRRLATTTWVTSSSDRLFSKLLSDSDFLAEYARTLQGRLECFRGFATQNLDDTQVPYEIANAGVFLWIDLSRWVSAMHFAVKTSTTSADGNPEMELTRYLMSKGVYLQPGEAFFAKNTGRYRLVYTGNSQEILFLALKRLKNALLDLESRCNDHSQSTNRNSESSSDDGGDLLEPKSKGTVVRPQQKARGKERFMKAMQIFNCTS